MTHPRNHTVTRVLATAFLVTGLAAVASAADVYLVAKPFDTTMPDGRVVPMWGYALDADGDLSTDGGEQASSPGPTITVDPGDGSLTIHVRNDLPAATSLVMPGQDVALAPVFFTDDSGRQRMRSFQPETLPGAIGTYSWPDVSEGTYLYQSGTHSAVQVQMGLFGAFLKDIAPGQVYSWAASKYVNEAVLVYSEVDPDLHDAISDGSYGSPPYESTIGYRPRYFLVNGATYPDTADIAVGAPKEVTLLRLLNAGQESHSLVLRDSIFAIVGEQGRRRPNVELRGALPLPAGKTLDVLTQITTAGRFPIYDRSLYLANADAGPGGMLAYLQVTNAEAPSKSKSLDRLDSRVAKLLVRLGDIQSGAPASPAKEKARAKKIAKLQAKIAKFEQRAHKLSESLGLGPIDFSDA